ncbi:hypothetical protein O1D97_07955 [Marinomonas sp. 15G1-11]|uniref:Uncharacterized protein n=1 Tax=Marinomonas phaeophyticola TaxID=3004091 RepID=A0ABT4JTE5_9GAMM|nr:hypothetical protein [Marinomonas sp. 15G1-11]MCZ2721588.1 hypothetical protein [Marinomonas sp. 15G1-11]
MKAVNEEWFQHPFNGPYINTSYKNNRLGVAHWRSYMEATGGGFNKGGIAGPFVLPAGMELWKLSAYKVGGPKAKVSEWWCAKNPFKEQTHGLRRSLEEAALNGVPLNVYARIASCVKIEWNTLDTLQIIKLNKPVKALWGKFAPMNLHDIKNPKYWTDKNDARLKQMQQSGYDPALGDAVLGGLGAYQLFIPGMIGEDVTVVGYANANEQNYSEIKRLLGINSLPSGPNDLGWSRSK